MACITNCGTPIIPQHTVNCANATRRGAINRILFFRCNLAVASLTIPANFSGYIAAGNLYVTKPGIFKLEKPTVTSTPAPCETSIKTSKKGKITGYQVDQWDNALYADDLTTCALNKSTVGQFNVALLTCDGILIYNSDWVANQPIGFNTTNTLISENVVDGLLTKDYEVEYDMFGTTGEKCNKFTLLPAPVLAVLNA